MSSELAMAIADMPGVAKDLNGLTSGRPRDGARFARPVRRRATWSTRAPCTRPRPQPSPRSPGGDRDRFLNSARRGGRVLMGVADLALCLLIGLTTHLPPLQRHFLATLLIVTGPAAHTSAVESMRDKHATVQDLDATRSAARSVRPRGHHPWVESSPRPSPRSASTPAQCSTGSSPPSRRSGPRFVRPRIGEA